MRVSPAIAAITTFIYVNITEAKAHSFQLGNIVIQQSETGFFIHTRPKVQIKLSQFGTPWPKFSTDESGYIYVGNKVIDSLTGLIRTIGDVTLSLPYSTTVTSSAMAFKISYPHKRCRFRPRELGLDANAVPNKAIWSETIRFMPAEEGRVVVLAKSFGPDGDTANYDVINVDLSHCKAELMSRLGDPDRLVELEHTQRGGFWITGSIEQTLIHSTDGRIWETVALPENISSLFSAYYVSDSEIWLAAVLADGRPDYPFELVYTTDGGKNWHNLLEGDPMLARVPPMWIEGQSRVASNRDN